MKTPEESLDIDSDTYSKIVDECVYGEQKTVDEIAKEVCKDKASAVDFLKSAGIMNEKGELAEQYREDEQNLNVWNEEDEKMLNDIIMCGERHCYLDARNIAWLKCLKEKVQPQNPTITDEELAQAKKNAYNDALDKIEYHSGEPTFDDGWSAAIWYLKKKNAQFQNTWKPSDQQVLAIHTAIGVVGKYTYTGSYLQEVLEQVKKLREE